MKAITIDDSKTIRAIVKRTLKEVGFEVEEAENGLVALERIKQAWPIDLAVVDWNMPNMNGIELVREIRRRSEWSGMRIMMATTESEISQMQIALEAGADEYLMKPFDRVALEQKLALLGLRAESARGTEKEHRMERIRVLVVDDSTVVRRVVAKILGDDPRIEVVGRAENGKVALEKVDLLRPDLLTLDLEMPVMGGVETLAELRARGIQLPVIVFSAADQAGAEWALEALHAGASDYVTKPSQLAQIGDLVNSLHVELIPKIVALFDSAERANARVRQTAMLTPADSAPSASARSLIAVTPEAIPQIVLIGSSTGGPKALQAILPKLPASYPVPILIVQHMPPTFTSTLAKSLDQRCSLRVYEACDGAEANAGEVWIARGDHHMTIEKTVRGCRLHLDQGPKENSCRPAVDPLFRSAAAAFGSRALGVVLTGMGSDGLEGTRALRQVGACVVAQDEATSVVWGMPGAVATAGLADQILPQGEIALFLERCVVGRPSRLVAGTR